MTVQMKKVGPWDETMAALGAFGKTIMSVYRQVALKHAHILRNAMRENIKKASPLAASTLMVRKYKGKRGSKPLRVNNDLWHSIHITRLTGSEIFVGILRKTRGRKSGSPMVNIAQIHEYGRTFAVPATPKSKRFLAKVFGNPAIINSKADFWIVTIPARPFIHPAIDDLDQAAVRREFEQRVNALLAMQAGGK